MTTIHRLWGPDLNEILTELFLGTFDGMIAVTLPDQHDNLPYGMFEDHGIVVAEVPLELKDATDQEIIAYLDDQLEIGRKATEDRLASMSKHPEGDEHPVDYLDVINNPDHPGRLPY